MDETYLEKVLLAAIQPFSSFCDGIVLLVSRLIAIVTLRSAPVTSSRPFDFS